MNEKLNAVESANVSVASAAGLGEQCQAEGVYKAQCFEYEGGPLLWEEVIDNVVCTLGKNSLLDNGLTGSAFTQTGPYMGLISSVSYSAVAAADTMLTHTGWLEAGSGSNFPTFAARGTPSFSAASAGAKATASAVSFTMTSSGTLVGAFICMNTGAVTTIGNTGGVLFSAGAFTGGNQAVSSGNVVTVTYSVSI